MHRQLFLAAYDITEPRRRTAALKLVRGCATGGQKSVHELWLTEGDKVGLLAGMKVVLDQGDRFLLLKLDPRSRTLLAGRGQAPADPGHFYIA